MDDLLASQGKGQDPRGMLPCASSTFYDNPDPEVSGRNKENDGAEKRSGRLASHRRHFEIQNKTAVSILKPDHDYHRHRRAR